MYGINVGGFGKIQMNKKSDIKVEFLYSMEGTNTKTTDIYLRLNRLSIPLLFCYQPIEKISLETGPEFKIQLNGDSNVPAAIAFFESGYTTFDYGFSFGMGFEPFNQFEISIRKYFGLKYHSEIGIFDKMANRIGEYKSGRTNVISISINYYLRQL